MIRCAEAPLRRVDHQQQLHQVAVHRRVRRLHDEDVRAADRLEVAAVDLAVGERLQLDLARARSRACRRSCAAELLAAAPGEHHQPLVVRGRDARVRGRLGPCPAAAPPRAARSALLLRHFLPPSGRPSPFRPLPARRVRARHSRRHSPAGPGRCQAPSAGTSCVITEPAPVYAPSPTVTGATSEVWMPVRTSRPITVRCFATPS